MKYIQTDEKLDMRKSQSNRIKLKVNSFKLTDDHLMSQGLQVQVPVQWTKQSSSVVAVGAPTATTEQFGVPLRLWRQIPR